LAQYLINQMEQFLLRGSKKANTNNPVGGGSVQINTLTSPAQATADKEMRDDTKPKFTPWVEK
jgi:hypothetical protein